MTDKILGRADALLFVLWVVFLYFFDDLKNHQRYRVFVVGVKFGGPFNEELIQVANSFHFYADLKDIMLIWKQKLKNLRKSFIFLLTN